MTGTPEVVVAMDWGGTWVRGGVINGQGEILWSSRVPNASDRGKERMLAEAEGVLRQAIEWCGDRRIGGVGVAAAGPIDVETGTFHDPPNLAELDEVSLKHEWEPKLGYPVHVGNDANLAALGEFHYGAGLERLEAGLKTATLVYITVSTGVGGGVVDHGRMILGAHGMAVEIGHMVIDTTQDAPQCQCGNTGCLEALASGTSIARITGDRLSEPGAQSILAGQDPESITSEEVFAAAAQGDRLAQSVIEGVVQALSVGLTNLLHLFDPNVIVMGGGVTQGLAEAGLIERVKAGVLERAMTDVHKEFSLVTSKLGDSVGMVGAASLVWQELGRM